MARTPQLLSFRSPARFAGLRSLFVLLLLASATAWTVPASPSPADLVLTHARIYTVDRQHPWAEALAISAGKILAVGTAQEIARYRGATTRTLDAGGHLVLPGFADCHVHFHEGAESLGHVFLDDTKTLADIQARLKQYAAAHPGTGWILGRGWNYAQFGAEALPHKEMIDAVIPDRPVFLEGYDGHTYWANSKALALAGIRRDTPDPPNGQIVRDPATGEATGAIKEDETVISRVIPKPSREEKLRALHQGIAEASRVGLTRVHSAGGDFENLDLYRELERNGQLNVRMYIAYFLDPPALTPAQIEITERARREYASDLLSAGAVKTMLDGVVESHTAAMLTPYSDDPRLSGKLFWDPGKYKAAVAELDRRGFQVFTHAIGEAAVRLALDAYEDASYRNHTRGLRHRIEHVETITAADIPRFGAWGVIASMQPLHAEPVENALDVWARNAGPDRASRAFVWHSIAASGGRLAFGSDWPIVTLNPWTGLQCAVTRQTPDGTPPGGWLPAERVTLEQAVEAYTLGAAFAGHREKSEGSLTPGKLADLVIVSQDIFKADPHAIGKTDVLLTMLGGRTVYESPAFKAAPGGPPGAAQ